MKSSELYREVIKYKKDKGIKREKKRKVKENKKEKIRGKSEKREMQIKGLKIKYNTMTHFSYINLLSMNCFIAEKKISN